MEKNFRKYVLLLFSRHCALKNLCKHWPLIRVGLGICRYSLEEFVVKSVPSIDVSPKTQGKHKNQITFKTLIRWRFRPRFSPPQNA